MSKITDRMGMNPSLQWLSGMMESFTTSEIKVPTKYRDSVLQTKKLLSQDLSGLVNSVLDYAINSAAVDYSVETDNPNLTDKLNVWLNNINIALIGKIPIGVDALAKEYYRERWKGSSFLLLRTIWEEVDGWILPTKLWFVDGEDITHENGDKDNNGAKVLGDEQYYLRISNKEAIPLPKVKNEEIFIQKPYSPWSKVYTVPFIIQRGIFKNLKFLEVLEKKGEFVVTKALEYLMLMKKGTEKMAMSNRPEFVYDKDDLTDIKNDLKNFLQERNTTQGVSTYTTNFDTEIEHLIPEYSKVLKQDLYTPIERRILAGLGLVEVVQGISTTRRESVLNPKPFMSEVRMGVDNFESIINDVLRTIIEKNKDKHKKYMNAKIKMVHTPIKDFLDADAKQLIRSIYDRGGLSKETFVELVGDVDFAVEVEKRKGEAKEGIDIIMYPPVTQNIEQFPGQLETKKHQTINDPNKKTEDVPEDKKGIEKKNFNQALSEARCPSCDTEFDFESQREVEIGKVACPNCDTIVNKADIIAGAKDFEQAPYTKTDYPAQIKNLPVGARNIWIKSFNSVYESTGDEEQSRKAAWSNVKIKYKKEDDKWTRKDSSEVEKAIEELDWDDLIKVKKLELFGKKSRVLDKFLEQNKED